MNPYKKGYRFERRVIEKLESEGYWVVRQAKSSFPDLVAFKGGETLLVECKVDRGYFTKREREELVELARRIGAKPILAYRNGRKIEFEEIA